MKVEFGDDKLIMSAATDAEHGSYALEVSPLKFEACRERFACRFSRNTKGFFFKHPKEKGEAVAAFILKTEEILKVRKHSSFCRTNKPTILWFQPAWFWRSCRCRRSLLTILLRAGMVYDTDTENYEATLFQEKFIVPTKSAVIRFMFGHTKYVGPPLGGSANLESTGWRAIFDGKENYYIKECLVSPKTKNASSKFDFSKELWI